MATSPTHTTSRRYEKPFRPAPIRLLNALGRAVGGIGLQASLREQSLVRAARRQTGLEFFGDEAFRVPLRRLLESIEAEARLHPLGRIMARTVLIRNLANRLRIEALRDREPEVFEAPIAAPVFIVGLQRTGTTVLQRMLALHPSLRALRSWEAVYPIPFFERRLAPNAPDPRIRIAELAERAARYLAPDFFAIHPILAHGEEEDSLVFDPSFFSTTSEALMQVPRFTRWLESADHGHAYAAYREVIQVLQWQRPGRWLGKTPLHLEHLEVLLATFPDARIVHTHRDPVETVASLCSMLAHGRGFFSDHVDAGQVGRQWLDKTCRMVDRGMVARAQLDPSRFIDVRYEDMVGDPLKEMHRVCDFIGAPLPADAERNVRDFLHVNPQHKHGRHEYSLADFGLSRDEVVERFSAYRERYGLGA